MDIFKACDVRGIYGQELTEDVAHRLGHAVGDIMRGKRLVVGGDLRLSTPALKQALIGGLVEAGGHVLDVGVVPTPSFYFAIRHLEADGGVMVTASHNPAPYNGFKINLGPSPVTEAELAEIERRVEAGQFSPGVGSATPVEIMPVYEDFIQASFVGAAGGLRVVIDAGNGSASRVAPHCFRRLGYQVIELFCEPDGRFPNRAPNPALPENLSALRARVPEAGADMGVAFDGDGDRVVFTDEKGQPVESEVSAVLIARRVLTDKPGRPVIYDLKCSSIVAEEVRRLGGVPIMERSGHAFIRAALIHEGAAFAVEISGHFFFAELEGDDGLFAALSFARLVAESGRSLSDLVASVPRYPITPDIRIPYQGDMEALLAQASRAFSDYEVNTLDGVRVEFPDGWGLIRASVTEPLITLRFEARTWERLAEIERLFVSRLPELAASYPRERLTPQYV
jgi:phosphomannomutase/phosphoglucomutase